MANRVHIQHMPHADLEDLELVEDDEVIVLQWSFGEDEFDLIYKKDKDIVLVMKNEKVAELKTLTSEETVRYNEALEIAINYHHERCSMELQ